MEAQGNTAIRSAGDGPAGLPLLEREHEIEGIEAAIARAAEGSGSLVVVEGPAGIGKTRVLAEGAERANRRGLSVLRARGGELEREVAFGVARQLFEPALTRGSSEERARFLSDSAELALIALAEHGSGDAGPADPFAPIHGLYWLARNLAESNPVALIVDDGHWSDLRTLHWLIYLGRRLADAPIVAIVGIRTGEPDAPAELAALELEAARVVALAPLSDGAVAALLAAGLGSPPGRELVAACTRASRGNPFLLVEILRALAAEPGVPEGEAARAVDDLGADSVARYVVVRLARFGPEAAALARATAVLGDTATVRDAAALAGLEPDQVRKLCDRLRKAEIFTPGPQLEFVHPLVRSAIYREQPGEERSQMHRRAAELLAGAGHAPRTVAAHLLLTTPDRDDWVVGRLREAAVEAAAAGAPDTARRYLERALAEPPRDPLPATYELGLAVHPIDPRAAAALLETVAEEANDPELRADTAARAALAHLDGGNFAPSFDWYLEALDRAEDGDRESRLSLEADYYFWRHNLAGRDQELSRRIRAVTDGINGGETRAECLALQALAIDLFLDCAAVEEVCAHAGRFPPPPFDPGEIAAIGATYVLAWSGRWDDARGYISRALEEVISAGRLLNVAYGHANLALIEHAAGRLPEAEDEARNGWELAHELAPGSTPERIAAANLLATLLSRGNIDDARAFASNVDLSAGPSEVPMIPYLLELRGHLRLALGDLEDGAADLLAVGEELERRRFFNPALSPWRQEAAPVLAALGRTGEAGELIAEAERRALAFGARHTLGTVLRARALIEPRGRQIVTLGETVAAHEANGPPHELARSLVELGAALRRDGSRRESREPLRRALELAHRCGAGGIESRAREELAAAGSRPRSVFRTGIDALTPSEARTARLAVAGLSNAEIAQRLFVTKKTVEKHLSNTYIKLEIDSRKELPKALANGQSRSDRSGRALPGKE